MRRLYCRGKKDFCDDPHCCNERCEFYDGSGSEYIEQQTKEEPAKMQTNGDRIRAGGDEKLAAELVAAAVGGVTKVYEASGMPMTDEEIEKIIEDAFPAFLEYVKSPATGTDLGGGGCGI